MYFRTFVLFLCLPALAFSYTVVRKDGKSFTGELISQTPEQTIIKDKEGITLKFQARQIDWEKTTAETRKAEAAAPKDKAKSTEITIATKEQKWTGDPISFDVKDMDIRDFFRYIAEVSHMNMVLDPAIRGTLTIKMHDVPWDQALDAVCKMYSYGYEIEGNVVSVKK